MKADDFDFSPFRMIGREWMLITAGNIKSFNMMTASWGGLGFVWGKPVAQCYIRHSRFTYPLAENNDIITLSFYDEKYREFFEALGNPYVMQSFFLLYSKDQSYIFEKEVLSKECDIPEDKIDDVIAKLSSLRVVYAEEMIINNEKKTMYFVRQRYELIAIFAMLNEFVYHANYFNLQTNQRNKALLLNRE
jgi:hypothetical protein